MLDINPSVKKVIIGLVQVCLSYGKNVALCLLHCSMMNLSHYVSCLTLESFPLKVKVNHSFDLTIVDSCFEVSSANLMQSDLPRLSHIHHSVKTIIWENLWFLCPILNILYINESILHIGKSILHIYQLARYSSLKKLCCVIKFIWRKDIYKIELEKRYIKFSRINRTESGFYLIP